MPIGDEFDELLSGYIDGRLTRQERQRVETALSDPAVLARLDQLRAVGESLRLIASHSQSRLPSDFASRVVAACSRVEHEPSLTEGHSAPPLMRVRLPVPGESAGSNWRRGPGRRTLVRSAFTALGLAALVFLAIWLPQRFSDPVQPSALVADRTAEISSMEEVTTGRDSDLLASSSDRESEESLNSLGEPDIDSRIFPVDPGRMAAERGPIGQIQYALVLDVELAQDARDQQVIRTLFEKYGIDSLRGLQPNEKIEQAISRMRFTVEEQPKVRPAEIYLIRAPAPVLDAMLSEIQVEVEKFPAYRFDLAFQTPTLSLSQAIADAIGESDSLSESFALALVNNAAAENVGAENLSGQDLEVDARLLPFESIPYQGNLVSTRRRQETVESSMELGSGKDLSFLLLLVR